jgi:hypothetical protein
VGGTTNSLSALRRYAKGFGFFVLRAVSRESSRFFNNYSAKLAFDVIFLVTTSFSKDGDGLLQYFENGRIDLKISKLGSNFSLFNGYLPARLTLRT